MKNDETEILEIGRIEKQSNRVLLYDKKETDYFAIAKTEEAKALKIGDKITCKPDGVNFCWYLGKL